MTEAKENRGAVRIDADVMDLIVDEQNRLRKLRGGKKPSYSEILRLMWGSYAAGTTLKPADLEIDALREDPAITPQNEHERAIVAAALQFDREVEVEEVREILYTLLKKWLPKNFKAGKKTA